MKKWLIAEDSDYFKDDEDAIKLEKCPQGGHACRKEMASMNESLQKARVYNENKEHIQGFILYKEAFDATFNIKEVECQICAVFFRNTILTSLNKVIVDLEKLSKGWFAKKRYKQELILLKESLKELQIRMNGELRAHSQ